MCIRDSLEAKIALAESKTVNHFGFFAGATRDNVRDLQDIEGMDGVCGIKIFMGSSTGDLLVHEQKDLENIFANTGGISQPTLKMRKDFSNVSQNLAIRQTSDYMRNAEM